MLVGDGRSGTTLVALVLSAHPELHVVPELHFTAPDDLGPSLERVLELRGRADRRVTSAGLSDVPELLRPVQFVRRCERAGLSDAKLAELVAEARAATGSELRDVAARLDLLERIGEHLAHLAGRAHWGLKLMKAVHAVDALRERWGDGLVAIHVVRDGRDVAASQVLDMRWGYATLADAAVGWPAFVADARRALAGTRTLTVRYEDVVLSTESTVRAIVHELGLPWADAVLRHHEQVHPLRDARVRHDSAERASSAIDASSIGRHRRDLSRTEIEAFNDGAAPTLTELGYRVVPAVRVSFALDDPSCAGLPACREYRARILERIGERFFGRSHDADPRVVSGILDLTHHDADTYLASVKRLYKGNVLREARKAAEAGFAVHQFARALHVPDIVDINTSMSHRSGGAMKPTYLRTVEESGGPPRAHVPPPEPACPVHYDVYWGAFLPVDGYRQGDVVTDERLVAYVNVRRLGSFAMYNLIIGHGDFLRTGVMYHLHFEIVRWILARGPHTQGLRTVVYAGFYQGGEGLQLWKKKTGFEPAHLLLDPALDRAGAPT